MALDIWNKKNEVMFIFVKVNGQENLALRQLKHRQG